MKVLVIDEEVPYPLNTGKRIRTWNLLTRLKDEHDITFLSWGLGQAPAELGGVTFLNTGKSLPDMQGPRFYASLIHNLVSPLPYSVQRHAAADMQRAFAAVLAKERFDLVHCEWTPYVEVARSALGRYPVVLAAHNVESQIWERYLLNERNPLKREYIRVQYRKYARFERQAVRDSTHVVAVSNEDAKFFQSVGGAKVTVVPNGVDHTYFQPWDGPAQPLSMVFTGSMDWRPNQDGIRHFLQEILPRIRKEIPEAHVSIVGRNPPAWLREMAGSSPGVHVTGTVDDVRPHIGHAALYVVPLRVGGGSRLKILEALAMRKIVLSTTLGAEGLRMEDGVHLLKRDDPLEFAQTAVEVLRNPGAFATLAEQGRDQTLQRYAWDGIARILDKVWRNPA
jgi:polysaccharide biosynthesis protein PslH